jgi:hypothetical protein
LIAQIAQQDIQESIIAPVISLEEVENSIETVVSLAHQVFSLFGKMRTIQLKPAKIQSTMLVDKTNETGKNVSMTPVRNPQMQSSPSTENHSISVDSLDQVIEVNENGSSSVFFTFS